MILWLILTILFSAPAPAEEVRLHGVSDADAKQIRKDVPEAFTGELSYEEIDNVVRLLSLTGNYERVLAEEDDNGSVQVVARPLRTVKAVVINGERNLSERDLKEIVGIQPGERFERKKVVEAGERLKQFYGESGYFNTVIEVSFAKESDSGLSVIFQIDEKPPCLISDIIIETENRQLDERLARLIKRLKNKPLTTERMNSLRARSSAFLQKNRYLKTELLGPEASYNADKTSAKLTFRLSEPFRYEFLIEGVGPDDVQEVYRQMSADTLERGGADPAQEAADRIRQSYLLKGYSGIDVQTRTQEIPDRFLRKVFITVTEGQKVKITGIQISGRVSRPNDYYENFILNNSSPLVQRGYYNRQALDRGYENLLNELRNQGFLRAKVQSSRLEYLDRPNEARVVLVMDEGPLTQLQTITFSGAAAFKPAELASAISLKANSPLRLMDLEKSLEQLVSFYRARGYLEARILNETEDLIEYNDRGTQANVRFDIYEGPKVVVSSISIEGNSFTKADVIMRSIDIQTGDVLTPQKIEESEIRLNRLGIFSRAAIRTMEEGTNVSHRNLVISVNERDPGTFRLGMGVNSERDLTLRGFLGLSYNNLFGTARGLSGRAELKTHVVEVNYPQYEVVAGYLEPFLLNSRTRGRVNLSRSERVFEFEDSTGYTKVTVSNKIDFYLERDITRNWRVNWKLWSLDSRRFFERYNRCDEVVNGVTTNICTIQQVATIGPLIDADYRNDPFVPSRGHFSTWNMDYSDPNLGSSDGIHFVRTELSHTRYFAIGSPRYVFASSLRGGYLANLSDEEGSGVPTSHAFFLGGLSTIRGFGGSSENERIPSAGDLEVTSSTQRLIRTDSHYFLLKNEFRFPLYGDHGGVFFYDGGMVKVTGVDIRRPYRDSVGFGYRYNTPVGPFSLDLGFKINPEKDEEDWRVHFSWGNF